MPQKAQQILKDVFGYDEFRPLQGEVIDHVLNRRDALVIMPTGGGKSLCYQIPALIFEGLTIVVSPLISLMKDQVEQLREVGASAILLNSTLSREEYSLNIHMLKNRQASLLYVAPETLFKTSILELLGSLQIDCITIDEAHCISEWGHDFRPEYRQLSSLRKRFPHAVFMALTATATPQVQEDICNILDINSGHKFLASFNRENLFLQVFPKADPARQTLEFLQQFPDQSGIIYCFSRRQVEILSEFLGKNGLSVRPYHAGLSDDARRENQELFIRDDVQIIVATIAFGMGINKSNVRFVIHYDLPKSIESYYQEIGRAGRDGVRADCLLLFSAGDAQKVRFFIDQKEDPLQRQVAFVHLDRLIDMAETEGCRRIPLIRYFGEDYLAERCDMCDNCQGGEKEKVDITLAAQKFLSCVFRTGQLYGAGYIIDVLRGSAAKKILSNGHQHLTTYGIGKEYSKKQWSHLSRQFSRQGLLSKDLTYGSLKLTTKASQVLSSQEKVFGTLQEETTQQTRKTPDYSGDYDRELFTQLRQKRKELADAANVAPFVIFSDKSLIDMATFYPQSEAVFLQMHGVGQAKMKRYGHTFLHVIREFANAHNKAEIEKTPTPAIPRSTPKADFKPRYVLVAEAYNNGASLKTLMAEYGVKITTILAHLYNYAMEGNKLRNEEFAKASRLSQSRQDAVIRAFEELGVEKLRPVYDAMNGRVNYEELQLLRLYYLNR